MIAIAVGVVVALVLAQLIDGRVAFFLGLGTTLAISDWRNGRRSVGGFARIALGVALGLGVFFLLLRTPLNGWLLLAIGSGATLLTTMAFRSSSPIDREAKKMCLNPEQTAEVLDLVKSGDRQALLDKFGAIQDQQRKDLKAAGVDVSAMRPEIGKELPWADVARQVFRVLEFDRLDTKVGPDGLPPISWDLTRPYGYLRVESPIFNQPVLLPIQHRDDFGLAGTVFDEPRLAEAVLGSDAELLVTYAPKRMTPNGLAVGSSHVLHYVITPRGTLERYYPQSAVGDERMRKPAPEKVFGPFVYEGEIKVPMLSPEF